MSDTQPGNAGVGPGKPAQTSVIVKSAAGAPAAVDPARIKRAQAGFCLGWGLVELVARARLTDLEPPYELPGTQFPPDLPHFRDPASELKLLMAGVAREAKDMFASFSGLGGELDSCVADLQTKVNVCLGAADTHTKPTDAQVEPVEQAVRAVDTTLVQQVMNATDQTLLATADELLRAYEVGKGLSRNVWTVWGTDQQANSPAQGTQSERTPVEQRWDTWRTMFSGARVEQLRRHLEALSSVLGGDLVAAASRSLTHWRAALLFVNKTDDKKTDDDRREWPRPASHAELTGSVPTLLATDEHLTWMTAALQEQSNNWYDLLAGRRALDLFPVAAIVTNVLAYAEPDVVAAVSNQVTAIEASASRLVQDIEQRATGIVEQAESAATRVFGRVGDLARKTAYVVIGVLVLTVLAIAALELVAHLSSDQAVAAALGGTWTALSATLGAGAIAALSFFGLRGSASPAAESPIVAGLRADLDRLRTTVQDAAQKATGQVTQGTGQAAGRVPPEVANQVDAARKQFVTGLEELRSAATSELAQARTAATEAHLEQQTDNLQEQSAKLLAALQAMPESATPADLTSLVQQARDLGTQARSLSTTAEQTLGTLVGHLELGSKLAELAQTAHGFASEAANVLRPIETSIVSLVEDEARNAFAFVSAQIRLEEHALAISEPLVRLILELAPRKPEANDARQTLDWFLECLYDDSSILGDLTTQYLKLSRPAATGSSGTPASTPPAG